MGLVLCSSNDQADDRQNCLNVVSMSIIFAALEVQYFSDGSSSW